jgi:hypothetical protein
MGPQGGYGFNCPKNKAIKSIMALSELFSRKISCKLEAVKSITAF